MSLGASKNDKCVVRRTAAINTSTRTVRGVYEYICMMSYAYVRLRVGYVRRTTGIPQYDYTIILYVLAGKTLNHLAWQSLTHSRFSCFCVCLVHGRYLFPDILQPLALHDDRVLFVFELLP